MGYPKFSFNINLDQTGKRDREQTISQTPYRARKERKP